MPSGNAIYTYTGPEESTEVQGQIFLKDQPKHITDQGVIAACAAREDFEGYSSKIDGLTGTTFTFSEDDKMQMSESIVKFADRVISESTPAKPKKAKSK